MVKKFLWKNKKEKRRFIKKAIIPFALLMVLSGGIIKSSASTTHTGFRYEFGNLNGTRYTDGRAKANTSYAYMHCSNITSGYSYTGYVVASLGNGKFENASGGHEYEFQSGTTQNRMVNYVRENNHTAAAIAANAGLHIFTTIEADGYWAPDTQ